ncbi:Sphingolipid C4-hydroxylase sur2, partial [Teratosphaeria destructans]
RARRVPATPSPGGAGPDSSLLARVLHAALDYGRWFLGVGPYSAPPLPSSRPKRTTTGHADGTPVRTEQIHVPRNYGDSPREGYKYVWSQDHFPRLRLSSGVEMPGSVMLDEWRFDRPVFDLEAGP